eukprot:555982-Amphidinium_carterae.2
MVRQTSLRECVLLEQLASSLAEAAKVCARVGTNWEFASTHNAIILVIARNDAQMSEMKTTFRADARVLIASMEEFAQGKDKVASNVADHERWLFTWDNALCEPPIDPRDFRRNENFMKSYLAS